MRARLRRWLRDRAYPMFECEDCIGGIEYGCYCARMGGFAPGGGIGTATQRLCRKLYVVLYGEGP